MQNNITNELFSLPKTREEYTQMALMYSETDLRKTGLYGELCRGLELPEDDEGVAEDLIHWIRETIGCYPDLVEFEYLKKFKGDTQFAVYVAGVFVFILMPERVKNLIEQIDEIANQARKRHVAGLCSVVLSIQELLEKHCHERKQYVQADFIITKDS